MQEKILWLTGAEGYLGRALAARLKDAGFEVVGTNKEELDINNFEKLEAFARQLKPYAVINCAGIRRDNSGLLNHIKIYETNALGARNVALAADMVKAVCVQVSTDDVYSKQQTSPISEFDPPNSDTHYGKSKRAAELMVRDTTKRHIILRASWLYRSEGSRLGHILDNARKGRPFEVRSDHIAAPASLKLYTEFLLKCLENETFGTFHVASVNTCTHEEFARLALKLCGYDPEALLQVRSNPAEAENIVLDTIMSQINRVMDMPTWEEDLQAYLAEQHLLA